MDEWIRGPNIGFAFENINMFLKTYGIDTCTLLMIDDAWKEHLREMDDLRQTVQNAVYEQKDPLLIYKFEFLKHYFFM